jgi:aminocarboxymuconate-semialdehyde decarboxylase
MPKDVADPVAGFRKLWFDSVLFDPATLRYLRDLVGADRIVLGSDYPFPIGDLNPVRIVRDAKFGADEERRILGETAAALFHVHAPARAHG